MAMCGTKKMKSGGKAKTPSSATRRGHGAYGRELSKQRQLDDAIMRFQGEDLEAGRAADMKAGGKVKKMKGGGLAMLSPAYALAKSLESGEAEGLMKLSPLAQAMSAGRKNKEKAASVGSVTGMKAGGKVKKMAMGGKSKKGKM